MVILLSVKNYKRGVSLSEVAELIKHGKSIIATIDNQNYPNQKMFVLEINNYVWLCPFVETNTEIFIKTIYPSRRANKTYNGD